jgi:hypothetical protein
MEDPQNDGVRNPPILLATDVVPGVLRRAAFLKASLMNSNQTAHIGPRVGELRSRLQSVNTLLHSVASAGGVEDSARNCLEFAIQSIEAVTEDLAMVCEQSRDPAPDRGFVDSRVKEARSEVDSGEFDMHG